VDNINWILKKKIRERNRLAQDMVQLRDFINNVRKEPSGSINGGDFLDRLGKYKLQKKGSTPRF
jgi:hypothetical protein